MFDLFPLPITPVPTTRVLNLSRMAQRLGVSTRWLREQIEAGRVPAAFAGGGNYLLEIEAAELALAALASNAVPHPLTHLSDSP